MLFSLEKLKARFAGIRRASPASPHRCQARCQLHGLRERNDAVAVAARAQVDATAWLRSMMPRQLDVALTAALTDFKRGFTEEDADALRRMLSGFRDGEVELPMRRAPSLWA